MHGLARRRGLGLDTGLDEFLGAPPIILAGADIHDVDDRAVCAGDCLLVEIVAALPVDHKVVAIVSPASQQLAQ